MLTDSDAAATIVLPAETAESGAKPKASPAVPARRKGHAGLRRLPFAALIAGLLGFNAWWYWRDTRPVADLRSIEGLIARQQFTQAEAALRERLRLAPHDGETRTTLGRVLAARGDLLACARELDEVPYWWPKKAEALYREAQALLMVNRARDAETVLLAVIDSDPLHPPDPAVFHDASQELLKIYATEDRWDDCARDPLEGVRSRQPRGPTDGALDADAKRAGTHGSHRVNRDAEEIRRRRSRGLRGAPRDGQCRAVARPGGRGASGTWRPASRVVRTIRVSGGTI